MEQLKQTLDNLERENAMIVACQTDFDALKNDLSKYCVLDVEELYVSDLKDTSKINHWDFTKCGKVEFKGLQNINITNKTLNDCEVKFIDCKNFSYCEGNIEELYDCETFNITDTDINIGNIKDCKSLNIDTNGLINYIEGCETSTINYTMNYTAKSDTILDCLSCAFNIKNDRCIRKIPKNYTRNCECCYFHFTIVSSTGWYVNEVIADNMVHCKLKFNGYLLIQNLEYIITDSKYTMYWKDINKQFKK